MKKIFSLFKIQKFLKILLDFKFAILLLLVIGIASSIGSIIEQDESKNFYEEHYSLPIYGFITSKLIFFLGLNHIYRSWWFIFLLIILVISLIGCTITRQFPLIKNSKNYFFKKKENLYKSLAFFVKIKNFYFLQEILVAKIQKQNYYLYQNKNFLYAFKGLLGRISPILVHISLVIILFASFFSSFQNFQAQEFIPRGEIFHIQNPVKIGWVTSLPSISIRVNDFWVEYDKKNFRIHQFYSNLSILDNYANELKNQTINVNNPLRYLGVDFYQSDWNLIGIRLKKKNFIYEYPLYSIKENSKIWISFLNYSPNLKEYYTIIIDQFQDKILIYNKNGKFINQSNFQEKLLNSKEFLEIIEILPSTGLLIKYDPTIPLIYLGFSGLMITTLISYLPYTQFWVGKTPKWIILGSISNRGNYQAEIDFENIIREVEKNVQIKFWAK